MGKFKKFYNKIKQQAKESKKNLEKMYQWGIFKINSEGLYSQYDAIKIYDSKKIAENMLKKYGKGYVIKAIK